MYITFSPDNKRILPVSSIEVNFLQILVERHEL